MKRPTLARTGICLPKDILHRARRRARAQHRSLSRHIAFLIAADCGIVAEGEPAK